MAEIDTIIYIGDEGITGGDSTIRPHPSYPYVLGGQAVGHAQLMEEFGRIEPSGADGVTEGEYRPFWDGVEHALTVDSATATTVVVTAMAGLNEFAGREIEVTSGTGAGTVRVVSNTGNAVNGTADAITLTVTPAWDTNPVASDTVTVKGGFVYYYHEASQSTKSLSLTLPPIITTQTRSMGDNWQNPDKNAITPMTTWMNALVKTYGYTGSGFKVLKIANTVGLDDWEAGEVSGEVLYDHVDKMIDFAAYEGDTLKVRACVLDTVFADLSALNLNYESDVLRFIDDFRDQAEVKGITDAATTATATASSTTSVTVSGAGWTVDEFKGRTVRIDAGSQAGELRIVASNTSEKINFYDNTGRIAQDYGPLPSSPGTVAFSILASPLIVLNSPHPGLLADSVTNTLAPAARQAHRHVVAACNNVRVHDWSAANFATSAQGAAVAGDEHYDLPSMIAGGYTIHSTIQAFYTQQPTALPGAAIPVVAMIGTSQMVCPNVTSPLLTLAGQKSYVGTSGTTMPGVWIWDNETETVVPYDVSTVGATFGTVSPGTFGQEASMARDLVRDQFPNGVVIFKFAEGAIALTSETDGLSSGYVEKDGDKWNTIALQWSKFKQACIRDIDRSPDTIANVIDLGENDLHTDATTEAFETKAPQFVDDFRELTQTRVDGSVIPTVWMQGPPSLTSVDGGSALHDAAYRDRYRAKVAELPELKERLVIVTNDGPADYELQRDDDIHYGHEANHDIGREYARLIIEQFNLVEGGDSEESTEAAALVVETGAGLTDANSFTSVADADSYFLHLDNPEVWTSASTAEKEAALRQATTYLQDKYGGSWRGSQSSSTQALAWPRGGVTDANTGFGYDSDEMPRGLRDATAEVSLRRLQGVSLRPDIGAGTDGISASSISIGPISINDTFAGTQASYPRFPEVESKVRPLLSSTPGGVIVRVTR